MYHSYSYQCTMCGDTKDLVGDCDGGKCQACSTGQYRNIGESYDNDYAEQQQYEKEQDREYENRHRYD